MTIKTSLENQNSNPYDCKNRFFQKRFEEKWKFDEQMIFCPAYVFKSKAEGLVPFDIASVFIKIVKIPWLSKILLKAKILIFMTVEKIYFSKRFAEKWKFDEQEVFYGRYVLTSKPDGFVLFGFASIFINIFKFHWPSKVF